MPNLNLATADPDFEAAVLAEVQRQLSRLAQAGAPPTHRSQSMIERRVRRRLLDKRRRELQAH